MAVQLQRDADFRLERRDEVVCVIRREQPAHVLDADTVRAHVAQAARFGEIVFEIVNLAAHPPLVGHGVADGQLKTLPRALDGFGGALEVRLVVERVEHPEHVDAVLGGALDEGVHDVVGVGAVADKGLPAQQHGERGVGQKRLERPQPLPRVFVEESRGGVESRAAPDLHGVEAYGVHRLRERRHVLRPQPRSHEGLVSVPESGVAEF